MTALHIAQLNIGRARGPVDGPYRFTVGEMARVEVYVPEDQIDDAALDRLLERPHALRVAEHRDPRRTGRRQDRKRDPRPRPSRSRPSRFASPT